jgi:hypothetical protein
MVDDIILWLGEITFGAIVLVLWIGGMITGGDFLTRKLGPAVGDWFSMLWFMAPFILGGWVLFF